MNIVALTGGVGSGKSAACDVFNALAVPIVDLDVISHALTAADGAVMPIIISTFGETYVTEDGALNRRLMREKVFNAPEAMQQLNDIMHPAIYQAAIEMFELHDEAAYQILAIPLLEKASQYQAFINHVLVIDCDVETQIQRVMQRSTLSQLEVEQIVATQISRQERLALADTVIKNDTTLANLRENVIDFHQNYIKTCIVNK